MIAREDDSCPTDEALFDRKTANARPLAPSERAGWLAQIRDAIDREAALFSVRDESDLDVRRASFEKWRLIHHYVRRDPWRDRASVRRSDQWRDALAHLRAVYDAELIDWLALQVEVAGNLERGVQDMRPRKGGPSWLVALEYVGNRKRKALALVRWAESAAAEGCYKSSDPHIRLDPRFGPGAGGHEEVPFIVEREG